MSEENPLLAAQQQFAEALPFNTLTEENLPLAQCLGRILAEDILAPMPSPPYHRAIAEGYIVNVSDTTSASEDSPARFTIIGKVNAGDAETLTPATGEAVEVVTGSYVCDGDVTLTRMWEVKTDGAQVLVSRPFPPRFFIEDAGCDIAKSSVIANAGSALDPWLIGQLASLGVREVTVKRRPRVAIFASGDEVIPYTEPFKIGAIYDCNSVMLQTAIQRAGGEGFQQGIQSDDFDGFVKKLQQALNEHDMVVISGGTAVGGRDFISDLIKAVGELVIDGVQMRSGRPLIMGHAMGKPIVCVAGHPPEALRGFQLFGVLAMNKLLGADAEIPADTKS